MPPISSVRAHRKTDQSVINPNERRPVKRPGAVITAARIRAIPPGGAYGFIETVSDGGRTPISKIGGQSDGTALLAAATPVFIATGWRPRARRRRT